jgi:dihydroflavonol-4-reductase
MASFVDPTVKQILPELGMNKNASNEKARRLLGWNPRSREESILATAESLIHLGLVKKA